MEERFRINGLFVFLLSKHRTKQGTKSFLNKNSKNQETIFIILELIYDSSKQNIFLSLVKN